MIPSMFRKAMVGDGSTLNLDFTTMTATADLTARGLTFTRGSNGTRINASGFVETMSNNVARFDHDPTTLAPRGLLVEGASTNLCEQGQYCWGTGATNTWARSAEVHVNAVNGTAGASAVARIDGPDGGSLTGTSLFKQAGTATFVRTNINVAVAQSTTYTFSAYVRAPSGGNPYMRLAVFNGGTWLNTTGDTTASGITITNTAGNGSRFNGVPSTAWVRIWVTFTTQAGQTSATIAFYPDTDTQSAATMYVWGGQVESGSGPSSVILTGASTATRVADFCLMTGTNFSSWYQGGTQGTFYADWFGGVRAGASGSTNRTVLSTDDVSTKHLHFLQTAAAGNLRVADFGGTNNVTTANTLTSGARTKGAFGYNGSSASVCLNGGTVATGSSLAFSVTPTWLVLGATSTNGTSLTDANVVLNNSIRQIKYWPTRLADGTLQGLTS